jgi:hypothetical protein
MARPQKITARRNARDGVQFFIAVLTTNCLAGVLNLRMSIELFHNFS